MKREIQDDIRRIRANRTLSDEFKFRTLKRRHTSLDEITLCLEFHELGAKCEQARAKADLEATRSVITRSHEVIYAPVRTITRKWMDIEAELFKVHLARFRSTVFAPWGDVRPLERWLTALAILWMLIMIHARSRVLYHVHRLFLPTYT